MLDDINQFLTAQKQMAARQVPGQATAGQGGAAAPNAYSGAKIEQFPLHLSPPRGSESFDIRKSVRLSTPDLRVLLVDWTIPDGSIAIWNGYALFSDVPAGVEASWEILVNGNPAFKYHGDSLDHFRKTLALGSDLSTLVYALMELAGGSRIQIYGNVTDSAAACTVAARIVGWLITDRIAIARSGS